MSEKQTNKITAPAGPSHGGPGSGSPMGMIGSGQKAKNFGKTIKNLIKYLKPFWISIIFVFVFAIASTVFTIMSPKILIFHKEANVLGSAKMADAQLSSPAKVAATAPQDPQAHLKEVQELLRKTATEEQDIAGKMH